MTVMCDLCGQIWGIRDEVITPGCRTEVSPTDMSPAERMVWNSLPAKVSACDECFAERVVKAEQLLELEEWER